MPSLEPLIAGRWNGHSLWMQWTPAEAPDGYRVEISVFDGPDTKRQWKLIDAGRTLRPWMVIPIWRHGAMVQARVAVNGVEGEPETAKECVFQRSTCLFHFQAGAKALVLPPQSMIHCAVDGATCSYVTGDWIDAEPGETVKATLSAVISSGWSQLDREGDFDLHPAAGARIWNAEPSVNDVVLTGRDYTVMEILPRDGPLTLAKKAPRNPNFR